MPDPVLPLAERLLACLCNALEDSHRGPVCACCLHPGSVVPMDYCDCECAGGQGQAWVRVARIYPTGARFPSQTFDIQPCQQAVPSWAVELVMGVYRCIATIDDEGRPPDCAQVTDDAVALMSDAAAMRQAAMCCFPDGGDTAVVVGEYTPIGPSGGCGGGQLSVTVQAYDCCP